MKTHKGKDFYKEVKIQKIIELGSENIGGMPVSKQPQSKARLVQNKEKRNAEEATKHPICVLPFYILFIC